MTVPPQARKAPQARKVSSPKANAFGFHPEAQSPSSLPAAKAPMGPGFVMGVGLVLAVSVLALGVVGVHDALVRAGAAGGPTFVDAAVKPLDSITPGAWLVPLGIGLVLLGLWLLLAALRPRRAVALQARTGVFMRSRDVENITRNAVEDVDGVMSAKVTAGRRKVAVTAWATATDGMEQKVAHAVAVRLQALAKAPTVRITVKTKEGT